MRKLTYGVGYNSRGEHKPSTNGKQTSAYIAWRNMLSRCYNEKTRDRYPTYFDCTVADEWHDFQTFAKWFEEHEYSGYGYHLDKDVLHPNNKEYGPENCCFIPFELNMLLVKSCVAKGVYPQGVSFCRASSRFKAQLRINSKNKTLGYYDHLDDAIQAYKTAKEQYVKEKALEWQGRIASDVFQALMNWELQT